jgi:hypothetical protein
MVALLCACSKPLPPRTDAPKAPTPEPVKITQFYAPPNPPSGEKMLICYGVENAKEVRLDPPVETVFPAMARCFEYTPKKAVTLKLTAIGENSSVTQSLEVRPGAPRVHIIEVSINSLTV